jgi:ubiquitin C-terminal hydrolase
MTGTQASKENVKSPSTYGKEAYEEYRKKEKKKNRTNPDIASKNSERQITDNVTRQDMLHGQKRTKIVSDFRYATVISQLLKDFDFPAHKNTFIQYLLDQQSESINSSQSREVLSLLQQIQEKYYKNVSDIIQSLDLVRDAT